MFRFALRSPLCCSNERSVSEENHQRPLLLDSIISVVVVVFQSFFFFSHIVSYTIRPQPLTVRIFRTRMRVFVKNKK